MLYQPPYRVTYASLAKQEELVKAFKALLKEEKFSSQGENRRRVAGARL